jgi:hypothetical protein
VGFADEIVSERIDAGKTVKWPPGMTFDDAVNQEDYPAEIWKKAEKQWSSLTEEQKQAKIDEQNESIAELQEMFAGDFAGEAKKQAFMASFTPFDFLWFGLALYTAFNVGYGSEDE